MDLYFCYNFVKFHRAIRATPAGVTVKDLVEMAQ
jgi:hypothetical protein